MLLCYPDCIKVLLKYGADPRATDEEGRTPLDIAKDDYTKTILYDANRKTDSREDKKGIRIHCVDFL